MGSRALFRRIRFNTITRGLSMTIRALIKGMGMFMILLAAAIFWPAAANAETFEHEFVGAKKCSLCHKKPEQGEQYQKWLESKHAKAFETLGTPASKEMAD